MFRIRPSLAWATSAEGVWVGAAVLLATLPKEDAGDICDVELDWEEGNVIFDCEDGGDVGTGWVEGGVEVESSVEPAGTF
jgi:hypothetical protein